MRKKPDTLEVEGLGWAGLGYDARALGNPWRQKLACCVGAKVTLKRLAARWDALQPWMIMASPTELGKEFEHGKIPDGVY